jgi:hypothetical protein
MKKVIAILTVMMISVSMMAQEPATGKTRAEKKAERKELKAKKSKELSATIEKAMDSGNYVVRADQLRDRYGRMVMVNSTTNFVAKRGDEAFIQFGPESGFGSLGSGAGIKGPVSSYEMKRDKNGYYLISFYVRSDFGQISVNISSSPTGEYAEARVQTQSGFPVSFTGDMAPVLNNQKITTVNNK